MSYSSRGGIFGFSVLEFVVIILAVVYNRVILKVLHRSIMGGYQGDNSTWNPEVNEQKSSEERVKKTSVNTTNLTQSKQAYATIAEQLYEAMQGIGTDDSLIYELCEPLNADELKEVYKAFGLRSNKIGLFTTLENANLIQWFVDEVSKKTISPNQEDLKLLWAKTGLWR